MNGRSAEELLEQYLAARDEIEAERRLASILEEVALPLVQRVVASAVRDPDAEDVVADTLMDLLRRLRDLRAAASPPIRELRRYIVTCAYNRCHERLRERYPTRNRLRNQLRYLCNHDRQFAAWRGEDGLVCGFRAWIGRPAERAERLEDVRVGVRSDPGAENRAQIAALLPVLLRHAGAPLSLDVLASAIARLIGVDQRSPVPLSELEPARDRNAEEELESRVSLHQLWDDVRRLAWKQRVALLLNLRDAHGRECLTLLPLTRIATIAEIAVVVGMEPEAFAALWNRLPLSDVAIAEILGATPRQVIKLRRLARERLRRMARSRGDQNLRHHLDSSSKRATLSTRR